MSRYRKATDMLAYFVPENEPGMHHAYITGTEAKTIREALSLAAELEEVPEDYFAVFMRFNGQWRCELDHRGRLGEPVAADGKIPLEALQSALSKMKEGSDGRGQWTA